MATMLRIETIGRCVAYVGERRIDPSAEMVFAALLYLGLERRRHSRGELARLFWPKAAPNVQRARLRWLLSKLRGLGLEVDAPDGQLAIDDSCVTSDLSDAVSLPTSEIASILPGYAPTFSERFLDWTEERRSCIAMALIRQLLPRFSSFVRTRAWDRVVQMGDAILRIDPLHEEATLGVAEARWRLGAKSQGLQLLDRFSEAIGERRPELHLRTRVLSQRMRTLESNSPSADSPFVGRKVELARINDLLATTRLGRGGAVALTGPAGIGKTRLLEEACALASISGMQVAGIRCQRADRVRPLPGIIELVPKLINLRGALGCDPEKLSRLQQLTRTDLSEARPNESSPQTVEHIRAQILDAVLDLLEAVSQEAPLVIHVDDAQWVESSFEWLWKSIAEWSCDHPVAWLFAFRTPSRSKLALDIPVAVVGALDEAAVRDLLLDLEARFSIADTVDMSRLIARGTGNPLFLRELARHCGIEGSTDQLPTTLVALLERGLAGLGKSATRVVQVAAILDKFSTIERIEAIARLPRADFVDAVAELEDGGILATDASSAMTSHALWAEAVLARMSMHLSRILHRHAADQFAAESQTSPDIMLVWECARHWELAGDKDRARAATVRGALHLVTSGLSDSAADAYQRAIRLATDPNDELLLRRRRIELLHAAGHAPSVVTEIKSHEELACAIDPLYDTHNDLELDAHFAVFEQTGDPKPLVEATFRCIQDTKASSRHRMRAAKECAKAAELVCYPLIADIRAIAEVFPFETPDDRWDRGVIEYMYLLRFGEMSDLVDYTHQIVAEWRGSNNPRRLGQALEFYGCAKRLGGYIADADAAYAESSDIYRRLGYLRSAVAVESLRVEQSLDFDSEIVTQRLIDRIGDWVATLRERGADLTTSIVQHYQAELAVRHNRPRDALHYSPPLSTCLAYTAQTRRFRTLAIHMSANLQLGNTEELEHVADVMEQCVTAPDYWHDWPASVLAEYFLAVGRVDDAISFAYKFVSGLRRERYPAPALLRELADRFDSELQTGVRPKSKALHEQGIPIAT